MILYIVGLSYLVLNQLCSCSKNGHPTSQLPTDKLPDIQSFISSQTKLNEELNELVQTQQVRIQELEQNFEQFKDSREFGHTFTCEENQRSITSHSKAGYNAYGCIMDAISLSCDNNQKIHITSATYGQYQESCSSCCPPSPTGDCTVSVQDKDKPEWAELKLKCDNMTSCSHTYEGFIINDCEVGYVADYMHIFYDCIRDPGTSNTTAFTAIALTTRQYNNDDVIYFDGVISNYGNHYDPASSIFTCPYSGIYLFSVQFYTWYDHEMLVELMKDSEPIIQAQTDTHLSLWSHAGIEAVLDCNAGQTVWARAGPGTGEMVMYSTDNTKSHFTGVLLEAYS